MFYEEYKTTPESIVGLFYQGHFYVLFELWLNIGMVISAKRPWISRRHITINVYVSVEIMPDTAFDTKYCFPQ